MGRAKAFYGSGCLSPVNAFLIFCFPQPAGVCRAKRSVFPGREKRGVYGLWVCRFCGSFKNRFFCPPHGKGKPMNAADGKTDVRILAVSAGAKAAGIFGTYLSEYETTIVSSLKEAKEKVGAFSYDVVILSSGKEENGVPSAECSFAEELVGTTNAGVILICREEDYESVSLREEKSGIYCLKRPLSPQSFLQGVHLAVATGIRLRGYSARTETLKEKMEEVKLVGRAKLLLITKLGLTEEEAHRYIEKQAMDKCVRRSVIATELIKTYIN